MGGALKCAEYTLSRVALILVFVLVPGGGKPAALRSCPRSLPYSEDAVPSLANVRVCCNVLCSEVMVWKCFEAHG